MPSSTTSIPNLFAIIWPFSQISGLTVSHTKSQALNLSLDNLIFQALQQIYNFKLQVEALPYLGIFLTPT